MPDSKDRQTQGENAAAISNMMVQLVRQHTGRGPTKARSEIGRDSVTIYMADTLTKAERTLAENGRADHVLQGRHQVQHIMRQEAVAAVESVMKRRVIAFMSDNHIDPDMAVEAFVLEPEAPLEH